MQHFSANSAGDLADALAMFDREKVKGIIMDLRGNPGGLYEQAQKVSDAFIKSGTLVSMVGVGGAQRKDETASDSGHEPTVPLAVLVNQNSASASEIVAGAMKNLDRGVVIGEGTFGKGSVQVLFDIPSPISFGDKADDDKLGLKLTTAQYLTPGDISIQGVGRGPGHRDRPAAGPEGGRAVLDPAAAVGAQAARGGLRVAPRAPERAPRREADGDGHLPAAAEAGRQGQARSTTRTRMPPRIRTSTPDADDDRDAEDRLPDGLRARPAGPGEERPAARSGAGVKAFLDKVRAAEDKKVSQALEKLGVDWTAGPTTGADPSCS